MKNWILISIFTLAIANSYGQKKLDTSVLTMEQVLETDWLSYNYINLDQELQPKVSRRKFEKWKKEYNFKDAPLTCSDSLKVILNHELKNADAARVATLRICYTWDRASWYVLLPEDEVKSIARREDITYPYQFVDQLRSEDRSKSLDAVIDSLPERLEALAIEEDFENLDAKELMKIAFRYSPGRLKVVDSILASQGSERRKDDH